MEIAANVKVEKQREVPAMNGTNEHSSWPNTHTFLKAVNGVNVADTQQTTMSEQESAKMNRLETVCSDRVRPIANSTHPLPHTPTSTISE